MSNRSNKKLIVYGYVKWQC